MSLDEKNYFILLICAMLGFGLLLGCAKKVPTKDEATKIPVSVIQVKKGSLRETLFYVGDIKADDEAIVYPKVTGKIVEKLVKEGDLVKKGDVLAYIDRDEVGFEFEKAPVESPIDGVVGKVHVDIGTSVSPQVPVGLVVNMDVVEVEVNVVERDLPKIKEGQMAQVEVDAYPNEIFEGMVERVTPVVDLVSRTASVEIEIPNKDYRLKPGMFARIKILIKEREDVLIITRDAIILEDSSNYVFVVKDGDKVQRQKIEIGLHEDNEFEVIKGLGEGEVVVTMGNARLKNGDTVKIIKNF